MKFIAGLSSWGKSEYIKKMLDKEGGIVRAMHNSIYKTFEIKGKKVIVLQHSNCDMELKEFIRRLLDITKQAKELNADIVLVALCACCKNELIKIFFEIQHHKYPKEIMFLKHHWDNMAFLDMKIIKNILSRFDLEYSEIESSHQCNSGLIK